MSSTPSRPTARRISTTPLSSPRRHRSPRTPSTASSARSTPPSRPSGHGPNPTAPLGQLRAVVDVYLQRLQKDNTKLAYLPKIKEFKGFCDFLFPGLSPSCRYQVDSDKLYRFMFYHVFREKKRVGGRGGVEEHFDPYEYERVVGKYAALFNTVQHNVGDVCYQEGAEGDVPDPTSPLGYDQINTYRSSVRHYYEMQYELNANRLRWDEINTPSVKKLLSIVKGRNKRVKKIVR
jgi:hypothetical protein